jgi:hypothetical protein
MATPIPLDADLLCGHCAHNLRGVPSSRCPECGQPFDRSRLLTGAIPWEARRARGRFRAYWATVRRVTLWPRRGGPLSDEVSLPAARSFRLWTVLLVFLTLWLPLLAWVQRHGWKASRPGAFLLVTNRPTIEDFSNLVSNPWFFLCATASLALWLIAVTGLPTLFTYSRGSQRAEMNLAWALYACAPLAHLPPLVLLLAGALAIEVRFDNVRPLFWTGAAVTALLVLLILLLPLVWLITTGFIIACTTTSKRRTVIAFLTLPLFWVVLAALTFGGIAFVVGYALLFLQSLR